MFLSFERPWALGSNDNHQRHALYSLAGTARQKCDARFLCLEFEYCVVIKCPHLRLMVEQAKPIGVPPIFWRIGREDAYQAR